MRSLSVGRIDESVSSERLLRKRQGVLEDTVHLTRLPPWSRSLDRSMGISSRRIAGTIPRCRSDLFLGRRLRVTARLATARSVLSIRITTSITCSAVRATRCTGGALLGDPRGDARSFRRPRRATAVPALHRGGDRGFRLAQPESVAVGTFQLRTRGGAGDSAPDDLVYSAQFDPKTVGLSGYSGGVTLRVKLSAPGLAEPVTVTLDALVATTAPARFEGVMGERVSGGGPRARRRPGGERAWNVRRAGAPVDAHGEPIGYGTARAVLEAGQRAATLRFFGLLFHESGRAGPYVLKTVTGKRLATRASPSTNLRDLEASTHAHLCSERLLASRVAIDPARRSDPDRQGARGQEPSHGPVHDKPTEVVVVR